MNGTASVRDLRNAITDEIFFALGLKRQGLLRRSMGWVFALPAGIFARYMAAVDEAVGRSGPPAGCQKMLESLGVSIVTQGRSHIPKQGPAIVLSNHPGAYDSMAIGSLIPRTDLKAIVSKTRFYQQLPNIHPRFFMVGETVLQGMDALRGAVNHLQCGGILLQFGSGLIEPDPQYHSIREDVFDKWSPSLEILLRKVPETQVVPTIASGVLLERFLHHPLTRLRRDAMDKRRLAEFIQVIQQLILPKTVHLEPHISFGQPFVLMEIEPKDERRLMPAVIGKMMAQLEQHLAWIQ